MPSRLAAKAMSARRRPPDGENLPSGADPVQQFVQVSNELQVAARYAPSYARPERAAQCRRWQPPGFRTLGCVVERILDLLVDLLPCFGVVVRVHPEVDVVVQGGDGGGDSSVWLRGVSVQETHRVGVQRRRECAG